MIKYERAMEVYTHNGTGFEFGGGVADSVVAMLTAKKDIMVPVDGIASGDQYNPGSTAPVGLNAVLIPYASVATANILTRQTEEADPFDDFCNESEATYLLKFAMGDASLSNYYDTNWPNGVELPSSVTAVAGTELELPVLTSSDAATFVGWSTAPSLAGGELPADNFESSPYTINGNATLYGYWHTENT